MSPVHAYSPFIRPQIDLGYGDSLRRGSVSSLPELIEFNAQSNPDHVFGVQNRGGPGNIPHEITFSQLQRAVEYASFWLVNSRCTISRIRREQSVHPVGILLGSDIAIFIYMAALLRIGTPVLLLSARLTPVAIAHLLKETLASSVLISSHTAWASKEALLLLQSQGGDHSNLPHLVDAASYEDLLHSTGESRSYVIPPKYTAFERGDLGAVILHSSGTTGLPKPIFHSPFYPLLYATCHRLPEQTAPFRFNVSTLPLYHGFGLMAPSLSLSIGLPFVLPPAGTIPTAKTTLATIHSCAAGYLFTVPSIIEEFLRLPRQEGLGALQNLEIVAVGGAPMKEGVGVEVAAAGVPLLNHWGCTELGAIAPIERLPPKYNWRYLMPRTDTDLKLTPLGDGSSYRLIGTPPGWTSPYEVQDLLEVHSNDRHQYKIVGRADDLLVLATGEKVRPTSLERTISEHPRVNDTLAFGDGQVALGLLVELVSSPQGNAVDRPSEDLEDLMSSILPYLERANALTDKHGKVSPEMIIFTRPESKPFIRTDKGTLARKAILTDFDMEIRACYARAPVQRNVLPFLLPSVDGNGRNLHEAVRSLVREIAEHPIPDSADLFEAGLDSLQASRLRQAIVNKLRVTLGLPTPVHKLPQDFCFEHPSIDKICVALGHIMTGAAKGPSKDRETKRIAAMEHMLQKYENILDGFAPVAAQAHRSRKELKSSPATFRNTVLLTGSTGSLGCFLLARLARDPAISKVICLNRRHAGNPIQRQKESMSKRGASIPASRWRKVVIHEVDMTLSDFGLSDSEFKELLDVTHIIHNAWPVNFNRNLESFEPHIQALCNLIRLSLLCSGNRPSGSSPTRLLFTSTISVAARFPILNPRGPFDVPETSLDAINTGEFGYPEAKWVCERMLTTATELYGNAYSSGEHLLHGSNVRIGQMSGPEGSGAWNESEHFPIIVRASRNLGALPKVEGSLSWMPVNRASDVIAELLQAPRFKPFYHLENPSRQSWNGILNHLSSIMGSGSHSFPIIPLSEWIRRVRTSGDDPSRNIAFRILGFLERDFATMAGGTVILRTALTKEDSPTLLRSTAVERVHLEEYVAYWKSVDSSFA